MAADFEVVVDGLSETLDNLGRLGMALKGDDVTTAMFAGGQVVAGYAKISIQAGNKTGKVYQHGNVSHQASAPGQAPATDTGMLVNSIGVRRGDQAAIVVVAARYGRDLEFGTSRMAARPYLRPALDLHQAEVLQAIAASLSRSLARAVGQ